MRYINPRFTYLRTYFPGYSPRRRSSPLNLEHTCLYRAIWWRGSFFSDCGIRTPSRALFSIPFFYLPSHPFSPPLIAFIFPPLSFPPFFPFPPPFLLPTIPLPSPLPSRPPPPPFSFILSLSPPLLLEVGPLNPATGSGERCELPQRGPVWGRAPAEVEFGAF